MKITEIKVSEIKPYELNAKLHDRTQIENVAESIKQFGWQQPIVVDKDYIIIIGHCRFEAAKILGLDKVPVQVADNLTEEQVKKLRIIDNKTNESDWDYELLKTDIEDLDFTDFELDFDFPVIDKKNIEEDNYDFDKRFEEIEYKSKHGDIYKLGNHYLMCGDATSSEDMKVLMTHTHTHLLTLY